MSENNDKNNHVGLISLVISLIKDFVAPTDITAEAFWSVDPLDPDAWLIQIHLRIGTRFAPTSIERALLVERKVPRFWLDYAILNPADLLHRQRDGIEFARSIARNLKVLTSSLKPFPCYDIGARAHREPILLGRLPKAEINPGEGGWALWIDHRSGISGTTNKCISLQFKDFKL